MKFSAGRTPNGRLWHLMLPRSEWTAGGTLVNTPCGQYVGVAARKDDSRDVPATDRCTRCVKAGWRR